MKKLAILGLVFFIFLSLLVYLRVFTVFDLQTTIKIQSLLGNSPVVFFSLFSLLGTIEFASVFLLMICLLQNKLNKLNVLIFYFITVALELIGKSFIHQSGPPLHFLKTHKLFEVPSDFIPHEFFSYPSGHSGRTAFISGVLILILWKSRVKKEYKIALGLIIVIFDFLMFASRVYLGEHWLSDVVGGALLGFSLAILSSKFRILTSKTH